MVHLSLGGCKQVLSLAILANVGSAALKAAAWITLGGFATYATKHEVSWTSLRMERLSTHTFRLWRLQHKLAVGVSCCLKGVHTSFVHSCPGRFVIL